MPDPLDRLNIALADRYHIERELGRGGMATVYLAQDLKHRRAVAIKVLRAELSHLLGPERFLREIEIAARLQHPLILPVFESGAFVPDDRSGIECLWFAMPFIAGESLRDRLNRERQLSVAEAVGIACEVAEALACAHAQGVVHRDIKPENILLSDGHAIVADFGIARAVGATDGARLTETGLALGTPAYMSPEQASGERNLDGRADVYALGCVLYEMLAGQPPFTGPTSQSILALHAIDPVPSLRTVRTTVPVGVEEAIARALNKVPAERYTGAAEFGEALRQGLRSPSARRRRGLSRRGAGVLLATGLALLFAGRTWLGDKAGAADHAITSLAVMPFSNLTGDTAQVYLAAGLTEQLVTSLAQIGALRVISIDRQSSERSIKKALRDNRIDATLAGSLQRAGNAVHITVKLVSADTRETLWAQGYDGELSGILNLQAEVARSVASRLRTTITPEERSGLTAKRRTVDPVAFDAYVRGTYFLDGSGGVTEFRKALGFLRQAIEADPTFAAAYAELSFCFAGLGYQGMAPPEEVFPLARAAALRAVELDSLLGEAHSALAFVEFMSGWNFIAAEHGFRRGLELNPRYARGYLSYMVLLVALNRTDEAIAVMQRAQEAEPLSLLMIAAAARPFYNARRYDEAIAQAQRALELDSTFMRAHYWRGLAYEQAALPTEAILELEQLNARNPISLHLAALGHAYAVGGQRGKAELVLEQLRALSDTSYVSPFDIATVYAGLGDKARTLEWLDKAYRRRAPYLLLVAVDPRFDAFRADPDFRELLRKIGLKART